jgi:hypothetical protein
MLDAYSLPMRGSLRGVVFASCSGPYGTAGARDRVSCSVRAAAASSTRASMLSSCSMLCTPATALDTIWIDPESERPRTSSSDSLGTDGLEPCPSGETEARCQSSPMRLQPGKSAALNTAQSLIIGFAGPPEPLPHRAHTD